jgi:putative DNA primase/helicase
VLTVKIATAPNRDSRHWRADDITWAELLSWVDDPADVKSSGNYFLGELRPTTVTHPGSDATCTDLHRRKVAVVSRSAITLDVDHPNRDFADHVEMLFPYAALLHTTFSSTPDDLRYRLVVQVDRDMAPDEYVAVAKAIMQQLGTEQFDPSTSEPERYMFRPAAQHREWFYASVIDGPPVPVDEMLADFEEDLSTKEYPRTKKRDPFDMEGTVGAFNRAYADFQLLIEKYDLPYAESGADRWQLNGTRSVAGMGLVAPGLVYSHHVTDPAYGQTCTAFDLVRLHLFSDLDEGVTAPINKLPSTLAMMDLAARDARVIAELVGVDFDEAEEEASDQDWRVQLRRNARSGHVLDTMFNWDLICEHERVFRGLYYNELTMTVESNEDLPWRALSQGGIAFDATDRANLAHYLERAHGLRPSRAILDELINTTAHRRFVNPVCDYLDGLVWDGVSRIETALPGVRPTPYTRLVARKSLVAAVARAFNPGVKWDHTLVLYGDEGLGKSFWIEKMSRGYSASLGRINDKDTLITMQRSWIMVSDEGHSLRKNDHDAQKEFLTRTEDVFRMPYERESLVHKRHCVIWSTTNDETFLRRQEGNRRFLIVHCEDKVDFDALTDAYINQVWAEAVHLYRNNEVLFLDDTESEVAREARERFVEEDALGGMIHEFLETLVPEDWYQMGSEERVQWIADVRTGLVAEGTMQQTHTCSAQIWVEMMGRRFGDHKRIDLLEISNVLKKLPGWTTLPDKQRFRGYGPQTIVHRTSPG